MDSSSTKKTTSPSPSPNSTLNIFLWHFFQTLTVSCLLLMVLSIYFAFASSEGGNIRVVCAITVAFAIISPSFIIPMLPQIASVSIPILWLNKRIYIRLLNEAVWIVCGYAYPSFVHLSCSSLMAGIGLLKLYGDDEGPSFVRLINVLAGDAVGPCVMMFNHEKKHGSGRWMDSSSGWALVGVSVVSLLAYYLPTLVDPEKKKMMMMMNELQQQFEKKKKKVNVAETPIPVSGTNTSETE